MARQVVFVEIMDENFVLKKYSLQMKILLLSIKINRNKFTPKIREKGNLKFSRKKRQIIYKEIPDLQICHQPHAQIPKDDLVISSQYQQEITSSQEFIVQLNFYSRVRV